MESNLDPNAVVAVDVVVFTLRPAPDIEDRWQVLLVRRDEPAFGNKLALPGVLVRGDETFDRAARLPPHPRPTIPERGAYASVAASPGRAGGGIGYECDDERAYSGAQGAFAGLSRGSVARA